MVQGSTSDRIRFETSEMLIYWVSLNPEYPITPITPQQFGFGMGANMSDRSPPISRRRFSIIVSDRFPKSS